MPTFTITTGDPAKTFTVTYQNAPPTVKHFFTVVWRGFVWNVTVKGY